MLISSSVPAADRKIVDSSLYISSSVPAADTKIVDPSLLISSSVQLLTGSYVSTRECRGYVAYGSILTAIENKIDIKVEYNNVIKRNKVKIKK